MLTTEEARRRLTAIPALTLYSEEPLARHTRFAIGGPARLLAETASVEAFVAALDVAKESGLEYIFIGGGTNLIVSDDGFDGIVLKYTAASMRAETNGISVDSGAELNDLVYYSIGQSLVGMETLAAIPGWVGAAIYGNAGAYGHSISESVAEVRFWDGAGVRSFSNAECEFRYRDSVFKRKKDCIIFSARMEMKSGDPAALRKTADDITRIRNEKFPPTMKCAGSIFKNLLLDRLPERARAEVPASVVREGKVPAAWFLEQVGAKGMERGAIRVADYHANLIYNTGGGTAGELTALIRELKHRVEQRFGLAIEEEVQYVGFRLPIAKALRALAAVDQPADVDRVLDRELRYFQPRLEKMLAEIEPVFEPYQPRPASATVEQFQRARANSVARLKSLAPDQFSRAGIDPERGRITLEQLVEEWAAL